MSHPACGTPSNVEVLLHCHYSPDPHPRVHAPAVQDGIDWLLKHGLIEATSEKNVWGTTEKGRVHIKALCELPFPVAVWQTPNHVR